MKSRVQKIEIQNFKAFREFSLDLEGRHLLLYGPNGSGKSSLYWALYTFLQSAKKSTPEVAKYFDPSGDQKLLNLHEDAVAIPGEIAMTLRDMVTKNDTTYRISYSDHGTYDKRPIIKGELASDFITYRFFFGFSDFRNSEKFNIWPLFEEEILPFCVSTGTESPMDRWKAIRDGNPNPTRISGPGGTNAYNTFKQKTNEFAAILHGIVDSISTQAQKFYDTHFAEGDPAKVTLAVKVTKNAGVTGTQKADFEFHIPVVEFGILIDGQTVTRPQVFLNEAKLTQLALSVRFAASMVNLHESDLKLLVLDDLLVSLDMDNRMKVVEILLSETFDSYQKIILTHDYGFFREFQRSLRSSHSDWHIVRLEGTPSTTIQCQPVKSDIQKAEEYLHGYNLDEAAICLRKACEDTAKRFIGANVVPTKNFLNLANALRAARKKVLKGFPLKFYEKIISSTPAQHRERLVATDNDDLDADTSLDPETRGRLKTNRHSLRKLLGDEQVERLRQIKLIDDVLACTERVLNPAAHSGTTPLYKTEVQNALDLVKQLETSLAPSEHQKAPN